jgi:hypothetical protein
MALKGWRKVNTWRIKGPFLVAAGLLGPFDHILHWGRASFGAGIAIVIPLIGFSGLWKKWKFWGTLGCLTVLQVPTVLALRPSMEHGGFPLLLAFSVLDCAFVITAISYVCANDGNDAERRQSR